MAGQQGVPTPGYTMGVDLGTSNTVAIVRWPDGRTRPLLFDGAPVMPSGVYAHPSGQLVAGRDASRLAGGDPARFEPNPKRRVDEPTVLLGDGEYQTADLLAALLAAVARAAVEAVGFLPPAVLTYPAAWGPQRRGVLVEAVRRAGWPSPHLVPEPVAAARYFADVLRRPVPVGASLAVFDFGGGTLDVAVVRNDGWPPAGAAPGRPPAFTVLGSGGVEHLGGLDVDAALVGQLGGLVARSAPETWRALAAPATAAQRRDRRLFWEDVRGAKEMLSRNTVAPVTVPGREEALHLTREELERVAQPLLRRAVHETAEVIRRCGLRPDQLAGLFLVGGSSRLPLVARMLHAELGVAPTVLEQPELPVAEGALAEIAPSPVAPAAAAQPGAAPSVVSGGPSVGLAGPDPAAGVRPWYRRRAALVAAGAGVVALGLVAAAGAWYLRRDPVVEFANSLRSVDRAAIAYPTADSGSPKYDQRFTTTRGDRAYVAVTHDDVVDVGAIDLAKGSPAWPLRTVRERSTRWSSLTALPDAVVVRFDPTYGEPGRLVVLDPKDGHERWSKPLEYQDTVAYFGSALVIASQRQHRTWGYRWSDGDQRWLRPDPEVKGAAVDTTTLAEVAASELDQPSGFGWRAEAPVVSDDRALVQVSSSGTWRVLNPVDGTVRSAKSRSVAGGSSSYLAYAGRLYVAGAASGASDVKAYGLTGDAEPTVLRTLASGRSVGELVPCGVDRLCLIEKSGSTAEVVTVDVKARTSRTAKTVSGAQSLVPVGDRLMVVAGSGKDDRGGLVDPATGRQLLAGDRRGDVGVRIGPGTLLLISGAQTSSRYSTSKTAFYGVGTDAPGDAKSLGDRPEVLAAGCSWNTAYLVCPTDKRFEVWRFAK